MVSRISLLDLLEDLPHVPCQQITRARPEVLETVPVVVLSGSDACLHVCRARLNMLVQPQTALDELPRAVDDLCANLDSQLSPGGKGDILELDVRRLLPRPHATDLDAFLLVDD